MKHNAKDSIKENDLKKTPIGQLLLKNDLIIPQDLELALEHQQYSREPLGEILIRIGAITQNDLEHVIGLQLAQLVR